MRMNQDDFEVIIVNNMGTKPLDIIQGYANKCRSAKSWNSKSTWDIHHAYG